jgi:hypothetical protein
MSSQEMGRRCRIIKERSAYPLGSRQVLRARRERILVGPGAELQKQELR